MKVKAVFTLEKAHETRRSVTYFELDRFGAVTARLTVKRLSESALWPKKLLVFRDSIDLHKALREGGAG